MANLKSVVAAELVRLKTLREMLLVQEEVEQRIAVGAARIDETVEGARRAGTRTVRSGLWPKRSSWVRRSGKGD